MDFFEHIKEMKSGQGQVLNFELIVQFWHQRDRVGRPCGSRDRVAIVELEI